MGRKLVGKERIDAVIEKIGNCHQSLIEKIHNEISYDFSDRLSIPDLVKYLNIEFLHSNKPVNRCTPEYWVKRGWSEKESRKKSKENSKIIMKNKVSPFSIEFWMEKGFSKDEADFIRNSKRPIKKEYWMSKGFSEKESIILAKNKKHENSQQRSC